MARMVVRREVLASSTAAIGLGLTGCIGDLGGTGGNESQDIEGTPDSLTALGGDSGGSGYQQCLGFQQVIESEMDFTVSVTGTDGWSANAQRMWQQGSDHIGVLPAGDVYDILHANEPYNEENYYVAQMYPAVPPAYVHAVVHADSGIEVYSDLAGQRINVLTRGSLSEQIHPTIMDALGHDFEAFHYPHEDAANALQQGDIDAVVGAGPAAAYLQLSQQEDIRVVTLEESDLDPISEELPWLGFSTVDFSEHYENANEALVPAPWTVMGCLLGLDNDFVYDLTSTVFNNTDIIASAYGPAEDLSIDLIPETNVAVHPGAQQYYEEEGIELPEEMILPDSNELPLEE